MNRMWKEPLLLALLGLASIGVVLSMRQLLFRPSNDGSNLGPERNNAALNRQVEESKDQIRNLERRLKDAEAKLQDIKSATSSESGSLVIDPTDHPGERDPKTQEQMPYQEALPHAWQYLQIGKFDSAVHKEILLELEAAYAVKGLPPEANSNLVSAIERMNELEVVAVISESKELPPRDASEFLQTFLDTTPKLSERQKARVKTAQRNRNR